MPSISPICALLTAAACGTTCALRADVPVHEPFEYAPADDPVAGRLEGRNGGRGFAGPWVDSSGDNLGLAFVYDSRGNPEALYGGAYGGGQPNWDGVVNNLPASGGYAGLSDWSNQANSSEDKWNSHRPLATSAGEMAGDAGVLWLSAVWHWPGSAFQNRPGIALTNGSHFGTGRSEFLTSNGTGIGVGNGNAGGWPAAVLNATVWSNGGEVAQAGAASMTVSGDHVIILKFEFGATDMVSAWSFTENHPLTEEAFDANAVTAGFAHRRIRARHARLRRASQGEPPSMSSASAGLSQDVTKAPNPKRRLKSPRSRAIRQTGGITLTWRSQPGEVYGLQWSRDLKTFYPGISQSIPADASATLTTFGPFPSPGAGCGALVSARRPARHHAARACRAGRRRRPLVRHLLRADAAGQRHRSRQLPAGNSRRRHWSNPLRIHRR
jgi:hypothetical protein